MLPSFLDSETKPVYSASYNFAEAGLFIYMYEDHMPLTNTSITSTLIIKVKPDSVSIDFVITGGKMGFRGASFASDNIEPLVQETLYELLVDFSKRYGLTMQESKTVQIPNVEY